MYYTTDIFDDMLRLRDIFDNFYREIYSKPGIRVEFPFINLYEMDDSIVIKAVVPGVKSEDVNIELNNNNLIIEGDRKSDLTEKRYIRQERVFGKFKKIVNLPYEVDKDKIEAVLKNGILTITLQKSEASKPKKIQIN